MAGPTSEVAHAPIMAVGLRDGGHGRATPEAPTRQEQSAKARRPRCRAVCAFAWLRSCLPPRLGRPLGPGSHRYRVLSDVLLSGEI
jgi:hypothetical protein